MYTIAVARSETETVVNRSRFVCTLYRVATDAEARERISAHRKANWDATHNCTAYVSTAVRRRAPTTTGNRPEPPASPCSRCCAGVASPTCSPSSRRHFGGVKLGAGGLVRAYGGAVSAAVDAAGTVALATWQRLSVRVDYGQAGSLEGLLRLREDVRLVNVAFGPRWSSTWRAPTSS